MFINTQTTAYPVQERDIKAEFPNISFPQPFVPPDEYEVVFTAPQPTFDKLTQIIRETTPVLTDKGHWEQQWEVVDLDAETVAANQEAARKALIPVSVSPRQIRQALTRFNVRAQVEAAVAAGDQDLKDWWEFATDFQRNHPMVVNMAVALNIDDNTLDAIFLAAGTL